ncbi:hypothetical protein NC797_14910 [Aquibacillus sp. 3ASR75-11]|uniref:Uncharacterized protein n=1 Tax=Terrihalobacillus insolitus TaxID=2950438 RepID=A0A9X3WX44_9BACI|nr:hypothetical protein [Terrihalobacillus insolitus]MDC3414320.1 hypothetical protein [Terrihalobacillus insolitus]MDC3425796.1 hypothetical protein [Terrihalobacillus insolitus]
MLKKLLPIFLVTLLALLLVGIKFYPELKDMMVNEDDYEAQGNKELIKDADSSSETNEKPEIDSAKHKDKTKPEKFPFREKAEEELAKKYPDKFNIAKKMYYAWDYIDNAQGEYEYGSPNIGDIQQVQFYVDFVKKKNRAKYERLQDGKVTETINLLLKDSNAIRQKPKTNIFTKEPVTTDNQQRYIGLFNSVITNSEWYTLVYNNYSDWNYKVDEKYGMPVYQIEGELSEKKSEDLAGPFTMVVSKDTGALLALKCYGQDNEVILYLKAKEIKINQGVSDDVFQLDVSGDKEVSNKEFNLSGIENYEKKPGGVETSND